MTVWNTRTELDHQILLLLRRGRSQREISRALGVTRGLVRRVVAGLHENAAAPQSALIAPAPSPATPRPSKLDVHEERIKELIALYPSITVQRVFEELRADFGAWRTRGSERRERVDRSIENARIGASRTARSAIENTPVS